ncbi:MAG: hypothetical protein WCT99_10695 [Bacteroidota bacterium]
MNQNNKRIWYEYWQDQFDAKEGEVVAPGREYPEVAQHTYDLALRDREKKERSASLNTILTVLGGIGSLSISNSTFEFFSCGNTNTRTDSILLIILTTHPQSLKAC